VIAGVPPIGLVIEGKVQFYKRKHGLENSDIICDMPLPVHKWPHPAQQVTTMETNEGSTYPTEIYTDGSKAAGTVGAGVAIYQNKQLTIQRRYKLRGYCSNNQAEQTAILKALEQLQEMETPRGGRATICTDSKVTLDSLKNQDIHGYLIEKTRNKFLHLTTLNWTINFRWVKPHTGIERNEVADKLAKEAAQDDENMNMVFDRIPFTSVTSEISWKGLEQWQLQWNNAAKGAVCQSFFPNLEQMLKTKIPITSEFTALVTGHGKTRAYLHRFQLADDPMSPCKEAQQTSDHIISECNILEAQRGSMIKTIVCSGGSWPPPKDELTYKYIQVFATFVKSIDFQTL